MKKLFHIIENVIWFQLPLFEIVFLLVLKNGIISQTARHLKKYGIEVISTVFYYKKDGLIFLK